MNMDWKDHKLRRRVDRADGMNFMVGFMAVCVCAAILFSIVALCSDVLG